MVSPGTIRIYLFLVLFQIGHSIEEYLAGFPGQFDNITRLIHRFFPFLPVFSISDRFFIFFNSTLWVVLLSFYLYARRGGRNAGRIILIVAIIELTNGILHLFMSLKVWPYFPGAVSAIGLLITSLLLISRRRILLNETKYFN